MTVFDRNLFSLPVVFTVLLLAGIATPTLFISGAQDGAATPQYMKPMQEAVPGSSYALLDPAGHISNVENPDRFNQALGDFLNAR